MRQACAIETESQRGVVCAGGAQPCRGRVDENCRQGGAAGRAQNSRRRRAVDGVRNGMAGPGTVSGVEGPIARWCGRCGNGARRGGNSRRGASRDRRRQQRGAELRQRRRVLRHTSRALPRNQRTCASESRGRAAQTHCRDRCHQACPGPRRCQSEEYSRRPGGTGAAGRGMRVVRRPGVRSRVLPESSAAQMPLAAGIDRLVPCVFRRACGVVPDPG